MTDLIDRYWKLAIVWVLSLIAVGSISSSAQVRSLPILQAPTIVSGNDIGFRIERIQDGIPIGTIIVRIDGRWIAAESSSR